MKRILLTLAVLMMSITAAFATVLTGTCGTNVSWTLDTETSVLRIEGTGAMSNYSYSSPSAPWYYNRSYVKEVQITQGVTSIGASAFYNCSSLTSITIPNSVTSIGSSAFSHCSSLTSITIPNSVTSIGEYAFCECSSLTSITIPNSVTSIGEYAFYVCSSLTSITIPNSVTSIREYAFSHCSSLTSITIPNSVTSIGNWAFQVCSSLISITIPESVTSIGVYAFQSCSALTSINIPECVKSIGDRAFENCRSLTSITIPNSVTDIGEGAFYNCSSLTSLTILEGVTYIGPYAFYGCSSLTSVTIPESVTRIGSAFYGCSSLAFAEFLGNAPSGLGTFSCNKIIVPERYYSQFRSSLGGKAVFPKNEICFTSTPTLKEFKAEIAKHDKSKITSITFMCDNLDDNLDEDVIKNGMNPNCVYYVPEGCAITGDNFVEIGNGSVTCNRLSLTDGYPFACIPIECEEVVYVHHPSVWANGKSGWETLCLPFSPTSIRASESGYLSPIVLGGNGNFWLRKYVGSSSTSVFFTSTADGVMEANTPYLVAFPGKSMGAGHLEGETITFSASNVTIDASADPEPITKNAFIFKSTFNTTPDSKPGYELNAEGSSFVQSATVGTKPFQAYFTNDELAAGSSVKSLRIDFGSFNDETGIFEVEEGSGMQAGTAGTFYDLSGRRISQGSAQQKGIYISNGRKVIKLSK